MPASLSAVRVHAELEREQELASNTPAQDFSEFEAQKAKKRGRVCGCCSVLSPEHLAKVNAAYGNGYGPSSIFRVITNWGYDTKRVTRNVVEAHFQRGHNERQG